MKHSDDARPAHRPRMSNERANRLRRWHEDALKSGRRQEMITTMMLGRTFLVPPEVYPPNLLGLAGIIPDEVRETDRVLDMGTGSGVNGIIAASKSHRVVAVDVSPLAVECAKQNAERNGVGGRVEVRESDLFQNVSGRFDLILFDPPFRWFAPRDLYERATADENYETLTSFFRQVSAYLTGSGRVLLSFGTTGDIDYLYELVAQAGLQTQELRRVEGVKDGLTVTYFVYRFTIPPNPVSRFETGVRTAAGGNRWKARFPPPREVGNPGARRSPIERFGPGGQREKLLNDGVERF